MIVFKVDGGYVRKYNVTYDKEQIEKLRDKLIIHCSKKKHITKESTVDPQELINPFAETITRLKIKNTGRTKSYDDTHEDKIIYQYDYILVTYPLLAYLLNELLAGNDNIMAAIMHYKIEKPINYNRLYMEETLILNKLIHIDIKEAKKLLLELNDLVEIIELNENCESTEAYYNDLINNILKFEEIAKISIEQIIEYKEFFDDKTIDFDITEKKLIIKNPQYNK